MDVLIRHRHGTETRATDVVRHGNTGDQWYRLEHAEGSTTLVPMDSILLVEYRDDQPPGEMSFDPETVQKMRDALKPKKADDSSESRMREILKPKKADPLPDVGPELFVDMLENDIRELKGANPNELALRLVERGWVKS